MSITITEILRWGLLKNYTFQFQTAIKYICDLHLQTKIVNIIYLKVISFFQSGPQTAKRETRAFLSTARSRTTPKGAGHDLRRGKRRHTSHDPRFATTLRAGAVLRPTPRRHTPRHNDPGLWLTIGGHTDTSFICG